MKKGVAFDVDANTTNADAAEATDADADAAEATDVWFWETGTQTAVQYMIVHFPSEIMAHNNIWTATPIYILWDESVPQFHSLYFSYMTCLDINI